MAILFDEYVFGPIKSRRFGNSLGINILPKENKLCSFDCIYCECGWTHLDKMRTSKFPDIEEIKKSAIEKFGKLKVIPDSITFAGNGEPTMHPKFNEIINFFIMMRDQYYPKANITVLSNSTQIHKQKVFETLKKIDLNVLKLDAGTERMYQLINKPNNHYTLEKTFQQLKKFNSEELIIQTLLLRGEYNGDVIDNTTEEEFTAWLNMIEELHPKAVMLYAIDRSTPAENLIKLSKNELELFADRVRDIGIPTDVF